MKPERLDIFEQQLKLGQLSLSDWEILNKHRPRPITDLEVDLYNDCFLREKASVKESQNSEESN